MGREGTVADVIVGVARTLSVGASASQSAQPLGR